MGHYPLAAWWKDLTGADAVVNILICSEEEATGAAGAAPLAAEEAQVTAATAADMMDIDIQDSASSGGPLKKKKQALPTSEAAIAAAIAAAAASRGRRRCLVVHSLVLSASSEYFKTRFYPSAATAAMICSDGGGGPLKVLNLRVTSSEHADALEAVMQFCYSHALNAAGEAAARLSCAELHMIVGLSDMYMTTSCMDAALAELLAQGFADCDIGIAITMFRDGLPPSGHLSPHAAAVQACVLQHLQKYLASMGTPDGGGSLPEVQAACLRALRLDDAEAVCSAVCAPDTATSFRLDLLSPHLSFQALLHLLQGTLTARSENSVLMMVDDWVAAHPAAPAAQQRQLAAALRLGRLSHAFLFEMLGSITWLHLTRAEEHAISRFATSSPKHQACLLSNRANAPSQRANALYVSLPGPAAWYAPPRTTGPQAGGPAQAFAWDVTEAQLQAALDHARATWPAAPPRGVIDLSSRLHFCNGATLQVRLRLHAELRRCRVLTTLVVGKYPAALIDGEVRVSINNWVPLILDQSLPPGAKCKVPLGPLKGDGLDIRSWAPYLADGVMRIRGTIRVCDESCSVQAHWISSL